MKYLKLMLWPFSLLYGAVMAVRNTLYDKKWLASKEFGLPVLAVGNLTVGGTGKTPHVEYLLRLLQEKYRIATLSRGYKRRTRGFVLADKKATAASIGDEPYQYFRDFSQVQVAVCEDRVKGVELLLEHTPSLDAILLDDAMQHRSIKPSLNLLITDYNRPFYKDFVLPAGLLREFRGGAKRADVVLVSKCPNDLISNEVEQIKSQVRKFARSAVPVFFTSYVYANPVAIGSTKALQKHVFLLTGIANAAPLKDYLLQEDYTVLHHFAYPDHHQYSKSDLSTLQQAIASNKKTGAVILTTRKDAVKLLSEELIGITSQLPLFYIPIEVSFLKDKAVFDQLILDHISSKQAIK
ncbi:tetraacyldisaccharide 4'-kinase [Pontibacter sp. SGAir0037]|nr:tetraacyldisaccharide 4'-kinase [Pontibacter sp. SGAir0037]